MLLVVLCCVSGSSVLLHRAVSSEIDAQLGLPWLPTYLKQQGIRIRSKLPGWHREVRHGLHCSSEVQVYLDESATVKPKYCSMTLFKIPTQRNIFSHSSIGQDSRALVAACMKS